MAEKIRTPAQQLEEFLNFVDQCYTDYRYAYEAVNEVDKRLQDLVHEIEFAPDKAERNRVATRLQHSRKERRRNKDTVKLNELVVKFFDEKGTGIRSTRCVSSWVVRERRRNTCSGRGCTSQG